MRSILRGCVRMKGGIEANGTVAMRNSVCMVMKHKPQDGDGKPDQKEQGKFFIHYPKASTTSKGSSMVKFYFLSQALQLTGWGPIDAYPEMALSMGSPRPAILCPMNLLLLR